MCGIAGVVSREPIIERVSLSMATASLAHRGPDAERIWWSDCDRVGLGHRRLAVIDLSEASAQPMVSKMLNCAVTFNGEIYNFRELRGRLQNLGYSFSSEGDTEVLLKSYAHWGEDCIDHLDGMFTFAIFDMHRNRLLLARDRAGEKPLFYCRKGQKFYFGSELKALFSFPEIERRVDMLSLECFLSMGYVPADMCMIRGIRKLPPAHLLTLDLESMDVSTRRYWDLPNAPDSRNRQTQHTDDLVDELETVLQGAVRRQMVADVPVGILLSGGVDSSVVTALAANASSRLSTYTVGFGQSKKHDEKQYADIVASHFGTEHYVLNAAENSFDMLTDLADILDEPVIDSSIIPTFLVTRLVAEHCTVVLGGDGGDELFGGYKAHNRLAFVGGLQNFIPPPLRRIMASTGRSLPIGFPTRNWIAGIDRDLKSSLIQLAVFFSAKERRHLLGRGRDQAQTAEEIWLSAVPCCLDIVDRATRNDFYRYLPEDILVKVDRASMANSLEMRAPFLDRSVIEFAYSKVPTELKATRSGRKILLKQLAGKLLPGTLDLSRKQGFSVPLGSWFQDKRFREIIASDLLREGSIFNRSYVSNIFDQTIKTGRNTERVFGLFVFENWARKFGVSL